jgi:hypothetical protein
MSNEDVFQALSADREQLETLMDDLSEFQKGCTDEQQETINNTVHIIQEEVIKLSDKMDKLVGL